MIAHVYSYDYLTGEKIGPLIIVIVDIPSLINLCLLSGVA